MNIRYIGLGAANSSQGNSPGEGGKLGTLAKNSHTGGGIGDGTSGARNNCVKNNFENSAVSIMQENKVIKYII